MEPLNTLLGAASRFARYRTAVATKLSEGLVNTVRPNTNPVRALVFWFFVGGLALVVVGGTDG